MIVFRKITPEVAKELLGRVSKGQRPVLKGRVNHLARLMVSGNFRGDAPVTPIMISKSGKLLNGQHRLWAIIQTGLTFTMPFMEDCDESTIESVDTNIKQRSSYDVLTMMGRKFSRKEVSVATAILNACRAASTKGGAFAAGGSRIIPNHLIDKCLQNYSDVISRFISYCGVGPKKAQARVSSAQICAALCFADSLGVECNSFRDRLIFGVGLGSKDPFHWLRNNIICLDTGVKGDLVFPYCLYAILRTHENKAVSTGSHDLDEFAKDRLVSSSIFQKLSPGLSNYFNQEEN